METNINPTVHRVPNGKPVITEANRAMLMSGVKLRVAHGWAKYSAGEYCVHRNTGGAPLRYKCATVESAAWRALDALAGLHA
jgi:hypothetical protein